MERCTWLKATALFVFFLSLVKCLKKYKVLLTPSRIPAFSLISSMVLGLLVHLQIFWYLNLIEVLGFLTGHGQLRPKHLMYLMLFTRFSTLFFFTESIFVEFQVRFSALFLYFLVIDGKCLQGYPIYIGVPQGSILFPTCFLLYINDLPDDVDCNIAIDADDITFCLKCG